MKICGWSDCQACAAMVAFMEREAAGEVKHPKPITSEWWQSAEADAYYSNRSRLKLPPCDHQEGLSWP